MAKLREQQEARRLRRMGWSLRRIAVELDVSLSSVSVWVRDVEMLVQESIEAPQPVAEPLEPLRRCARCGERLPLSSFNRYRNGHQGWCRECFRAYFKARGDLHRRQTNAAQTKRRIQAKRLVDEHLRTHSCVDCRERDPMVLEFDHVGPKRGNVSSLRLDGLSLRCLREEIAACEVVCVNCHRRRTQRRHGSWRLSPELRASAPYLKSQVRNRTLMRDVMLESGCVDCGIRDLLVLEFDHIGAKTNNVSRLALDGCSLARLRAEIDECEVRCANCHRRRTKLSRRPLAA